MNADWLADTTAVGLTAGASTPEALVQETIERLRSLGCNEAEDLETARENVTFTLPRELRAIASARDSHDSKERLSRDPQ